MSYKFGNAFSELMKIRNVDDDPKEEIEIKKSKTTMYKTPIKIEEVISEALAARAVAANDLWELKTGRRQKIFVDTEAAAALCSLGTPMTQKKDEDGEYKSIPYAANFAQIVSITQPWECKDGKWFLPHFNLPNLEKRVLDVLHCEKTPESVAAAVKKWNSDHLDEAIADARACGGIVYSPEDWLKTPQGKYLASKPVVEIEKIADSAPEPLPKNDAAPLADIKLLDLTRIIAGPTCGEALTEHGAKDLMVTAPQLPQVPAFVRDSSHGKHSTYLDYTKPEQKDKLIDLAKQADIFLEGYRPGSMEKHGFGAKDLSAMRPGIIYVSVNCHGTGGPYAERAGWDQVAQANTGISYVQGQAEHTHPKLIPVFLSDFLTGYLAAFGAMIALKKRATEGGSYKVNVSLDQSCMLALRQGLRTDDYMSSPDGISPEKYDEYAVYDNDTIYGDLKTLGPVIKMSETPCKWNGTTPELGSSKPEWW
ncbi:CoA transferase [Lactobacillus xujianguonis]|uniref:CoA transferase n=1 Tax=Lactobacillus xujianguonis TaxID=2495899 RepID=UPI000FDAE89C|nr:CoA transferase [Lactobacillus xujianguonis]RVU77508.1 CoA transferase [Lactobacillus xujianguonis]